MNPNQKRILYVDDQEDMCFLMKIIFDHNGLETVTANTAAEALQLARTENFDLFLIDNILPDMSGVELCREIRASDHQTPVVFFSGMERKSDREAALSAGAQSYVVKPAQPDAVLHAVRTALKEGVVGQ
jgi:DNA-binding response OmpR family regulator